MMHQINERADYSAEFWSLIHLESELMVARAYLNVFGSLPERHGMTIVAFWAGYEFTLYDLEPREWHSPVYKDVAWSVRSVAAYINKQDWEVGCQQARYELSQME
ncbi:hypothetical protein ENKOMM257B_20505 [Enterobacter kobei]|uniref:hypothetical protein n=1 Tax=Enterobacter TaxID=547 RepID=UPI00063AACAB|nr:MULTISPECIES: hypothetical protein [Enterobacter cloacae complex]CAE7646934.1 hypothetical protein AI2762V1_4767 [Enterobacter cloacae]HBM9904859.1 hypothetical protein [Enterobacter chengduensis]HCD7227273.1 hypothetical protein [Enterobacter hormaechei]ELR7567142.1 hypothetical protein [Enterobacter kobei]KLG05752.1 hypothetical protein YA47_18425 [Enterobacter asburiae]